MAMMQVASVLANRLSAMASKVGIDGLFDPHNMPAFEIHINGKDQTLNIAERFISLSLTDGKGFEADSLSLTLDDTDGKMTLPAKNEEIKLSIGWVSTGLVDKGIFTINSAEHSGPPDTISITALSAEFCGKFSEKKERSFNKTTLGAIVKAIALEHEWKSVIDEGLAAVEIAHIDQQGESNANLLARLGKEHDACATVKAAHLLFFPDGMAKTATGKDIAPMVITREMTSNHRWSKSSDEQYTGVVANWHDRDEGKRKSTNVKRKAKEQPKKPPDASVQTGTNEGGTSEAIVGTKDNVFTLPNTYASRTSATRAAIAKWQRLQRGGAVFCFSLPFGVPDLIPQQPIKASGWKADIDVTAWAVNRVTHDLSAGGFSTSVDCECVEVGKTDCMVE